MAKNHSSGIEQCRWCEKTRYTEEAFNNKGLCTVSTHDAATGQKGPSGETNTIAYPRASYDGNECVQGWRRTTLVYDFSRQNHASEADFERYAASFSADTNIALTSESVGFDDGRYIPEVGLVTFKFPVPLGPGRIEVVMSVRSFIGSTARLDIRLCQKSTKRSREMPIGYMHSWNNRNGLRHEHSPYDAGDQLFVYCMSCKKRYETSEDDFFKRSPKRADITVDHFVVKLTSCQACPPGTFKDNQHTGPFEGNYNAGECQACPAPNSTSLFASTSLSSCMCKAGFTGRNGGDKCTECPPGTYKTGVGEHDCVFCNQSYSYSPPGSVSKSNCKVCPSDALLVVNNVENELKCVCDVGFFNAKYADNTNIPNLPIGHDPASAGLCLAFCTVGQFRATETSKNCSYCPSGKFMSITTIEGSIGETHCSLCAIGTYMQPRYEGKSSL